MRIQGKTIQTHIKNDRLIGQRRKQIIEGALKIFTAKGFHQATVREIAEAAGVTMGTLYNYVRSKEDILFMACDYMTTILTDSLRTTLDRDDDPKTKFRKALRQNMELQLRHQDLVMFIYRESGSLDSESVQTVLAQEASNIEIFEELLRRHFEGKKIDEARLRLTADILSYLNSILVLRRWSLKRRYRTMDEVMDGLLDFSQRAIEMIEEPQRERKRTPLMAKKTKGLK
jgi:TetR/AcrR family transcriptional regulator, cholesterol catabolism regulator